MKSLKLLLHFSQKQKFGLISFVFHWWYYGVVAHLIYDDHTRIKWKEDSTILIENISSLKLETGVPSAPKPKFQMWIKPIPATTEDIDFEQANTFTPG